MREMTENELNERAMAAIASENYLDAIKDLTVLVARDNAVAMSHLALLYQHGMGVPKSEPEAVRLFEKAANLGLGAAAHNLGTYYLGKSMQGGPDSDEHRAHAFRWYRRAHELGFIVANAEWYNEA